MFGEDFDWCFRVKQDGWRVFHLGQARIIHIWGASAGTPEKAAWRVFITRQSKLYYANKHHGRFFYWRFCGVIIAEALVRGALTWIAGAVGSGPRADNWSGQARGYARLIRTIVGGRALTEKP
jgi:GT2 family glycosyltransferase